MKEQVAHYLKAYLVANLATEVAKLTAPATPSAMPTMSDLAAPLEDNIYLDEVVVEQIDHFPALVITFGASKSGEPYASPSRGVYDVDHEVNIAVLDVDSDPERLVRKAWRLEQAVIHCVPQARVNNAQPNTGQPFRITYRGSAEGPQGPARTGGMAKGVVATFTVSERHTVVVTTYA